MSLHPGRLLRTPPRVWFAVLALGLIATRLCHVGVVWPEEGLPLAAAVQMLQGKVLYRDIWFDKPPLVPSVYLLWGAALGWPLRAAGGLYAALCAWLAWRFAGEKWGAKEGLAAALLTAFVLTFWIPSAVIPLAADLLLVAPHLAAVYLAWRGRPFAAGAVAGAGLLFNAKAVLVLGACLLWQHRAWPRLLAGFAAPNLAAAGVFALLGGLGEYWRQVWELGLRYSGDTFVEHPVRHGLGRTANWLGFHAAPVLLAGWFLAKAREPDRWKMAGWAVLSFAAVVAGWRFFPRYYFQLAPVLVLVAARGLALAGTRGLLVLLLLLIPLARFGPRYGLLALAAAAGRESVWSDTAMDRDARAASALIMKTARAGDTLFVWGYRPDLFAYTRLPAASRFLESQPLSGVLADRHLFQTRPIEAPWLAANRAELLRSRPSIVVDGLGLYNPKLAIDTRPEMREWLHGYEEVARTPLTVIYRRRDPL